MLDQLLGRASLKGRVASLEEEKHHLQRELEAERERRADAVSDRQAAQQRVNRLEDRIAELEDRVERLQSNGSEPVVRREAVLRGTRKREVLDRLDSFEMGPEGALTAYVPDGGDLPDAVRSAFGDRAGLVARAAPCLAVTDDAGLVAATLSTPVPPEPFVTWSGRFDLDRAWFEPVGEYAVALVRSDLFALGEYEADERVAFHGFDADLKRQHSKGGFSQARFERLRDEQIASHLDRCREALAERTTDRIYVVGERSVIGEFRDVATVTRAVDATGDPEPALADAVESFWTVRLAVL